MTMSTPSTPTEQAKVSAYHSRTDLSAKLPLTSLDSDASIVHVATNVGQDLGLEAHLADLDAVLATLLGSGGRGDLDVLDSKVGKGLGDLHLGLDVEEGIGELLSLCVIAARLARELGKNDVDDPRTAGVGIPRPGRAKGCTTYHGGWTR